MTVRRSDSQGQVVPTHTEIKTLTLKSIAVAKIFMQIKNNSFNHVVIRVGALCYLQKKDVRNSEFLVYSKSKEKLDLFFIKSFYSEDSSVFMEND